MASLPRLEPHGDAVRLVVGDRPVLLLAGELHNSSASALPYVEPLLDKLARCGLNAVLAPVSWELVEPEEEAFDFALVDGLVEACRKRDLLLVPLWFGTMKNAASSYAPPWVKTDLDRFPRVRRRDGKSTWTVSPFREEIRRCDARAFAAVMGRIAEVDPEGTTVPLVQVENETGVLGAPRDYGPEAEAAFGGEVDAALTAYLADHRAALAPEFAALWSRTDFRAAGTWHDCFDESAEEVFMAWHVGGFVQAVAEAGRAVHPIPHYTNAWLRQGPGYTAGSYPSGGPVDRMLDVWKAAAPALDFLAPDIYHLDFAAHAARYHRPDNPLFVPEARLAPYAPANAVYALGRHDALGFSPFGIETIEDDHLLVEVYGHLKHMMPALVEAQGTGRMTAFVQQETKETWSAELDGVRFHVRTCVPFDDPRADRPGAALLIALGEGEFVAFGWDLIFTWEPVDPALHTTETVWEDEGVYVDGAWRPLRRLNGDETAAGTGVLLRSAPSCRRFRLHHYA